MARCIAVGIRFAVLVLLLLANAVTAAEPDPIDAVVRQYMEASHIPGVAIAVVRAGRIETLRAYGEANLDWNAAVTPDTAFQTASVSKIYTGVVMMRLVERGVVGLDDPLARYIDDTPASWAAITLRYLVTHTSGLPEGLDLPVSASATDVARLAMAKPLAYAPGSESRYGLTDYTVLTAALERATGLDWPALLQREAVTPLGLTHTGYSLQQDVRKVRVGRIVPQRASTYAYRAGVQGEELFLYAPHAYAAGGLYSSARDLATVFVALAGDTYLKRESAALLMQAMPLADGRAGGFGVGWTVDSYRGQIAVGHTGGPALGDVLHLPGRDLTIIALCNQRRFYPVLAKSIADLTIPAQAPHAAVVDTRPDVTVALEATLARAATSTPDPGRFEPTRGDGALGYLSDFGQSLLVAVGPVRDIALLHERMLDDGALRRTYRIEFARRTQVWVVVTDPTGRIRDLQPDVAENAPQRFRR